MALRILIADDHVLVRKGLKEVLTEAQLDYFIGEAADGEEALSLAMQQSWDLVILDITMPRRSGLEVLRLLRQERPELPVLMLSMHSDRKYLDGSRRAGAMGYLTKESVTEELLRAIEYVLRGEPYFPNLPGASAGSPPEWGSRYR